MNALSVPALRLPQRHSLSFLHLLFCLVLTSTLFSVAAFSYDSVSLSGDCISW